MAASSSGCPPLTDEASIETASKATIAAAAAKSLTPAGSEIHWTVDVIGGKTLLTNLITFESKAFDEVHADTLVVVEDGDACLVIPSASGGDAVCHILSEHFKRDVVADDTGNLYVRTIGSLAIWINTYTHIAIAIYAVSCYVNTVEIKTLSYS
jgi:hypothetical protein